MAKKVFIIHGWGGYPEEGWFPWLKRELESKGFEVYVPQMPEADQPRIDKWVSKIVQVVETFDENTFFVGHSMGCQAIVRCLESLPESIRIGGAVFVAGFFKRLTGTEDNPEEKATEKHWFETPVNLQKAATHLNKSIAIFSDNDPFVSLDNQDDFRNKIGSEILIEHNKGHFSGPTDKIIELPVVLDELLNMARV